MGSGHFLVTAVDFLSDYIAELIEYVPVVPEWLEGDYASPLVNRVEEIRREILQRAQASNWVLDEAQLTYQAIIRRMVLKRCIYGVDKNPLTVELAKVSLWLHSFTVGAPLSFLDHHLRSGDSLLGLRVPEAVKELYRLSRVFTSSAIAGAEVAADGMLLIEEMSDADVAEVQESARLFKGVDNTTAELRGLLDFFCGLRWLTAGMKKQERAAFEVPLVETLGWHTTDAYLLLARGPENITTKLPNDQHSSWTAFQSLWKEAKSLAEREGFLHWEAAFPGVWRHWQNVRPEGGFDAVIGNPPWDRIKLQEVEWFATRDSALALASTAAARRTGIQKLRDQGVSLAAEFDAAKQRADKLAPADSRIRSLPLAWRRRHQPLLPVRGTSHGPHQARRLRRTADALRHLRRQDGGPLLSGPSRIADGWVACLILRTRKFSSRTFTLRSNSAPSSSAESSDGSMRRGAPSSSTIPRPLTTPNAASRWCQKTSPVSTPTPAPPPSSAPGGTPTSPAVSTNTIRC